MNDLFPSEGYSIEEIQTRLNALDVEIGETKNLLNAARAASDEAMKAVDNLGNEALLLVIERRRLQELFDRVSSFDNE